LQERRRGQAALRRFSDPAAFEKAGEGYFSFVLPAPCPRCVNRCVSDNDFAKGMESVLDMFPIFFGTGHGKSPFPPKRAVVG